MDSKKSSQLNKKNPLKVAIAGSTDRTLLGISNIMDNPKFSIEWLITPAPKPVGRNKSIEPNPVHQFALDQNLPVILIEDKLSKTKQVEIKEMIKPDFLIVIDFGYLVPKWLLDLPKICPLNIHPSSLPAWRGSSPAQFVLLFNESSSHVSLIVMNQSLDGGDVVKKIPFSVDQTWTQEEYYQFSFILMSKNLPNILIDLAENKIKPIPQPKISPTPTARQLNKKDGYLAWNTLDSALKGLSPHPQLLSENDLSLLLQNAYQHHFRNENSLAQTIFFATRALSPWPQLWTVIKTKKGNKKMKILKTVLRNNRELELELIQVEGKSPTRWNKNLLG